MKASVLTFVLLSVFCVNLTVSRSSSSGNSNKKKANCDELPNYGQLKSALDFVVSQMNNGGFGLNMWGSIVNRDGYVCSVAMSGDFRGDQWPGSRAISAQKANTANAFSLDGLSLGTAALYPLVQPGQSLYGLQHSNPIDVKVVYGGKSQYYGTANDFMIGRKPGGVNVFGGGLGLYTPDNKIVGAIGVSGDTSCADHIIAWKVRSCLGYNNPPNNDMIVYPSHPTCGIGMEEQVRNNTLTMYPLYSQAMC